MELEITETEFFDAVNQIVDYLWEVELEDYKSNGPDERRVFKWLEVASRFLLKRERTESLPFAGVASMATENPPIEEQLLLEAIERVVDTLWNDELEKYTASGRAEGHLFKCLEVLTNWSHRKRRGEM